MRTLGFVAFLGLAAPLSLLAGAAERNFWPFKVEQTATDNAGGGAVVAWQGGGPLFFGRLLPEGGSNGGFRPFYIYQQMPDDRSTEIDYFYPLLIHREYEVEHNWSLLSLVNFAGPKDPAAPGVRHFDAWPVYFSRDTGDPATSYHAVFPLYGTILDRFSNDRVTWTLFPLYARFEYHGVTTTTVPWPIVKIYAGGGQHGFALWPLFGWRAQPGVFQEQYYLWPLIYKNEAKLGEPVPEVELGVLPFYARDQQAGALSETYLWPFFGYTHRTAPYRYDETRWFWPLLVQGHGDDRRINRWAPFYTHSIIKGDDKHWVLWPLFREETWNDSGLTQTKTQFLYFLYWSLQQRSTTHPALASAQKTHLWPLLSYWDDGAGRRQLQVLSPLEVFFPHNEPVRLAYTPLFALYRYEQRAPGEVRASFLWDAVTWRRSPVSREFHLGPLFSIVRGPSGRRVALGGGLLGLKRGPAERAWRLFLFDFPSKSTTKVATASSP